MGIEHGLSGIFVTLSGFERYDRGFPSLTRVGSERQLENILVY